MICFIQTRITRKNQSHINKDKTWKNETSDIWFATKTDEFLFKQHPVGVNTIERPHQDNMESNLWVDIPITIMMKGIFIKIYSLKYWMLAVSN